MSLEVFLVRHASALPAAAGQADARRPLSPQGADDFTRCVKGLGRLGLRFDRVLHSPLLRAVETAELLLPLAAASAVVQGLAEVPSEALFREVAPRDGECLALVGHEPWMSRLASLLLLGHDEGARALPFKKGGVAWLHGSFERSGMILHAWLPPKVLRAVRRSG